MKYKFRYYTGKVFKLFGICFNCATKFQFNPLNFTRHGQGICPSCSKRY